MAVHKGAGMHLHRLIALAIRAEGEVTVEALSKELWRLEPVGGTIRGSVRGVCVSKASSYLQRFHPGSGWELIGVEQRLGHSVADLVWRHRVTGEVFVDELKSGAPGLSGTVKDQVLRLAADGEAEWGAEFLGVRLVEMEAPRRAGLWRAVEGQLVATPDVRLAPR